MRCPAIFITLDTNTHAESFISEWFPIGIEEEEKPDGLCLAREFCRFYCGEKIAETRRGKSESQELFIIDE